MNFFRSLIGRLAVLYSFGTPNHRGRFRFFSILDNCFGPFRLKAPSGPVLEIFLSSSMDLSYFRSPQSLAASGANLDNVVPELIARLNPGECFVDVGANIGWLTCLASARLGPAGRVIAVEPSSREFERLLHGLALNRCTNVIPVYGAFGADDSVGVLEIAASHTGLNHLASTSGSGAPVARQGVTVQVPIWTGDRLLPSLVGARQVGLVKIDTEGAEMMVLSGLQHFLATSRPRHVVVEITPKFLQAFGAEKSAIYALMTRLGFCATVNADDAQYDEVFIPV